MPFYTSCMPQSLLSGMEIKAIALTYDRATQPLIGTAPRHMQMQCWGFENSILALHHHHTPLATSACRRYPYYQRRDEEEKPGILECDSALPKADV